MLTFPPDDKDPLKDKTILGIVDRMQQLIDVCMRESSRGAIVREATAAQSAIVSMLRTPERYWPEEFDL